MDDMNESTRTQSREDYLKAIYVLSEGDLGVKPAEIGRLMGVKNPSVSRAMKVLSKDGLISYSHSERAKLTEKGKRIAQNVFAKYELLKIWLKAIGVEPRTAAQEACYLEHALSDSTFLKLKELAQQYELQEKPLTFVKKSGEITVKCLPCEYDA